MELYVSSPICSSGSSGGSISTGNSDSGKLNLAGVHRAAGVSGSREPVDADGVLAYEKNGDLDVPGSACTKLPALGLGLSLPVGRESPWVGGAGGWRGPGVGPLGVCTHERSTASLVA